MTFGDGGSVFHPLVSLDVVAHEVCVAFVFIQQVKCKRNVTRKTDNYRRKFKKSLSEMQDLEKDG